VLPLDTDALAVNEVCLYAVTFTVWLAGAEPFTTALNVSWVGLTLNPPPSSSARALSMLMASTDPRMPASIIRTISIPLRQFFIIFTPF
jgi:hypothetical protein